MGTRNVHVSTIGSDPVQVRVDEYETAQGRIFSVYSGGRQFKRFGSNDGTVAPSWVEQRPNGEQFPVPETNATRLDTIYASRSRFKVIHRFPRTETDVSLCLKRAARAYGQGKVNGMLYFLDKVQHAVRPAQSPTALEETLTWENLPRLRPSAGGKTRWVIDSFLPEGNIQLVFGERGSFKSTLFLALAKAVAAGEKFLGMKTKRRKVLYLDYENPLDVIKARCDDLGIDLFADGIAIWDRFWHETPPKPGDPRLEELVKDCVVATGHGPWLIFDSWSSLLGPGEGGELTGQTAYKFVELRRLADLGATITVIDHTRKYDRSTIYGGQDKEAKADTIHNLQLYDDHRAHPVVVVKSWLKRHAPKNDGTFAFEVRSERDRKGNWHIRKILPAENPEAEQERRHIELLRTIIRANPNAGQEQIAKLAAEQGLARDAAIKLLKAGAGRYWTRERISHNKFRYRIK
jgi:hypothetical protein